MVNYEKELEGRTYCELLPSKISLATLENCNPKPFLGSFSQREFHYCYVFSNVMSKQNKSNRDSIRGNGLNLFLKSWMFRGEMLKQIAPFKATIKRLWRSIFKRLHKQTQNTRGKTFQDVPRAFGWCGDRNSDWQVRHFRVGIWSGYVQGQQRGLKVHWRCLQFACSSKCGHAVYVCTCIHTGVSVRSGLMFQLVCGFVMTTFYKYTTNNVHNVVQISTNFKWTELVILNRDLLCIYTLLAATSSLSHSEISCFPQVLQTSPQGTYWQAKCQAAEKQSHSLNSATQLIDNQSKHSQRTKKTWSWLKLASIQMQEI